MVATEVLVAPGLSPRNTRRRDHRANKGFIFVRQQKAVADAIQAAVIAGGIFEPFDVAGGATPLLYVSMPVMRKRHT